MGVRAERDDASRLVLGARSALARHLVGTPGDAGGRRVSWSDLLAGDRGDRAAECRRPFMVATRIAGARADGNARDLVEQSADADAGRSVDLLDGGSERDGVRKIFAAECGKRFGKGCGRAEKQLNSLEITADKRNPRAIFARLLTVRVDSRRLCTSSLTRK